MPSTEAMERRRREPHFSLGLKARRLQPTPSPNRSPDPARQPALAPGLSLVPHGCGDPLIRLVQEPQLNRVLEGWCSVCTRQKPPRAFERPGARAGCRAGPGDRSPKSTAGFKGAGVSKEGPRSFVRPLFGRSTAKRSNEGVRGRSPRIRVGGRRGPSAPCLRRRRSGLRPASRTAFGRPMRCRGRWPPPGGVQGPSAPARVDRLRRSGHAARALQFSSSTSTAGSSDTVMFSPPD
jgi:hypothetical protein